MRKTAQKLAFHIAATVTVLIVLLTLQTQAQTEKVIYSFSGADGSSPIGGVIFDANGNLYGTTQNGGANGVGTVFELSPTSSGTWTEMVLYSFSTGGDVFVPTSNLVFDGKGNLYGITGLGGANGFGGIFELSPTSNGTWSEKIIYNFNGGADIVTFQSGLAIDGAGNLYGYRSSTVLSGGGIFELVAGANGTWTEKILHTFSGGNDGSAPYGGRLCLDLSGNLYGAAYNGAHDFGLVFELVRGSAGGWSKKVLHTFTGAADGSASPSTLLLGATGNVFGASIWNLFELVPGANGSWTENILHTFTGGTDGAYPESGLAIGPSGTIYGTTYEGGVHHGTVFALIPEANGTWTEKVLHRFTPTGGDAINPYFATLAIDKKGNLYGTTGLGGASNSGAVFEVTP